MKRFLSEIKSILVSVKLSIALLIAIAILSIIGTFLPQEEPAELVGWQGLLYSLQMHDIFHSVFFYTVLGLLTINLVFCSLTRFPGAWKRFRGEVIQAKFKVEDEFISPINTETVREKVVSTFKKRRYRILPTKNDNVCRGQAGHISHLGAYIVHAGVIMLIIGALVSSIFGVEGYINLMEGEAKEHILTKGRDGKLYHLPFRIHLEKFTVDFYPNGMPKLYRSDIAIMKGAQTIIKSPLMVNHPLVADGFYIYQASYGELPGGKAKIYIFYQKAKVGEIDVREGDDFALPREEGTRVSVLRMENNFMGMGPAVKLAIHSRKGIFSFWVFKNIEKIVAANPGILAEVKLLNPGLYVPFTFTLEELKSSFYSGLHIKRDPGAPVVGLAAFFIVLGLIVTYFISPRAITVRWEKDDRGTRIYMQGTAARNVAILEKDLSLLTGELSI